MARSAVTDAQLSDLAWPTRRGVLMALAARLRIVEWSQPISFGSNRCPTAVTVMTTVVEPAAVKTVWLSNHCGRVVPAPLIAASLGVTSRYHDTQQRHGGR